MMTKTMGLSVVLGIGIAVSATNTAHAQGLGKKGAKGANPMRMQKQAMKREGALKKILDQLNLSPAQSEQITTIENKANTDGKTAVADKTMTPEQMSAKMQQVQKDMLKSIAGVLTPEQKTKFEMLVKTEMKGKHGGKKGLKGGTTPTTPTAPTAPTTPTTPPAPSVQ